MMKPLIATITGASSTDGYYYGIVSSTGVSVEGVSIFRDTLSVGEAVAIIQCGRIQDGAEYGFAKLSRNLKGVASVPTGIAQTLSTEAPYSVATSAIGELAGLRQSLYSRAVVTQVNSLSLVITLIDGPAEGDSVICPVDYSNGLVAGDFSVEEEVLVRMWPDSPVVVGWWEPSAVVDLVFIYALGRQTIDPVTYSNRHTLVNRLTPAETTAYEQQGYVDLTDEDVLDSYWDSNVGAPTTKGINFWYGLTKGTYMTYLEVDGGYRVMHRDGCDIIVCSIDSAAIEQFDAFTADVVALEISEGGEAQSTISTITTGIHRFDFENRKVKFVGDMLYTQRFSMVATLEEVSASGEPTLLGRSDYGNSINTGTESPTRPEIYGIIGY